MCVTWKGTPNSLPGHLPHPYSNASHTEPWPWHIHHRRGQLHVISMPFASCPLQAWPTYQCHESIREWHLLTSPIGRLGCVPVWDASCKPMAGAIKKELPTTIRVVPHRLRQLGWYWLKSLPLYRWAKFCLNLVLSQGPFSISQSDLNLQSSYTFKFCSAC